MPLHDHPIHIRHALMTEAHPHDRDPPREVIDDLTRYPCLFGRARTGRNDHMRGAFPGIELLCLCRGDLVVTHDHQVPSGLKRAIEFAKTLDEIPCERIVVIDQ